MSQWKPTTTEQLEARREYHRQWRANNPNYVRDYYAANKDRLNARTKERLAANPEKKKLYRESENEKRRTKRRDYPQEAEQRRSSYRAMPAEERKSMLRRKWLKTYGLTPESYDEKLQKQGGCCDLCGTHDPGHKNGWHVDHCHKTGQTRGIVCHHCNSMLANARDDIERLRKGI